jgi:hypothetical protein
MRGQRAAERREAQDISTDGSMPMRKRGRPAKNTPGS